MESKKEDTRRNPLSRGKDIIISANRKNYKVLKVMCRNPLSRGKDIIIVASTSPLKPILFLVTTHFKLRFPFLVLFLAFLR